MGRGWDFLFGVTAARPPVLVVVTGTLFITFSCACRKKLWSIH